MSNIENCLVATQPFYLEQLKQEIEILKQERKNDKYLKNVKIYEDISLTTNLKEALENCDLLVIGVATKYIESICKEINKYYKRKRLEIN